jgi:hypothetical protein
LLFFLMIFVVNHLKISWNCWKYSEYQANNHIYWNYCCK